MLGRPGTGLFAQFHVLYGKQMVRIVSRLILVSSVVVMTLGLPCRIGFGTGLPELRTPAAQLSPRINGPKVYGARPGHPFLYRIPCTGERPIHFSAVGLPSGLSLDQAKGIISGSAPSVAGDYPVTLNAVNAKGKVTRPFKIVVSKTLGLTPANGMERSGIRSTTAPQTRTFARRPTQCLHREWPTMDTSSWIWTMVGRASPGLPMR